MIKISILEFAIVWIGNVFSSNGLKQDWLKKFYVAIKFLPKARKKKKCKCLSLTNNVFDILNTNVNLMHDFL